MRMRRIAGIGFVALAALAAACAVGTAAQATVRLDPAQTFQTIVGWEATGHVGQESPTFPQDPPYEKYRDRLFDLVVDLGITRVRLPLRSGSEKNEDDWALYRSGAIDYPTFRCRRYATRNDDGDAFHIEPGGFQFSQLDQNVEAAVLPLRDRLAARGERLFVNLNYTAFTGQICGGLPYEHTNPEEYAEFILAAFLHLKEKYDLVPDGVEVILEPDNTRFWRGPQIGRAIVATGRRLAAHGFTPRFIAPSNTNMARAIDYFDALIQVPEVKTYLKEFSYHRYGGVSDANLEAIGRRAVEHNLDTSMLERIGAKYGELHADLKIGRNSAWARYIIADTNDDTGGLYFQIDTTNPDEVVVKTVPHTYLLRQYFKYIKPGARRIGASSDGSGVDPLAFVNPDGTYVVVLKTEGAGSATIQDLPPGTYGVTYATTNGGPGEGGDVQLGAGQPLVVPISGTGVWTVFGRPEPVSAAPARSR